VAKVPAASVHSRNGSAVHAPRPVGVSVVVCTHNGASRLPQTLAHLAGQQFEANLQWEVIVVDNASTDRTADVARGCWPRNHRIPLRVVCESRLGLSSARERGFSEARYEVVGFVDDDNWVCPQWVQTAAEVMSQLPEVGACGSRLEATCEVAPPHWFVRWKQSVAPAPPRPDAGDVSETAGHLNGAGLLVRGSAWRSLADHGFRFLLSDRQGTSPSLGGDLELCFALRLAGWKIWYEPRLLVDHFVPKERLDWNRLRRDARGAGRAYPVLALYSFAMDPDVAAWSAMRRSWQWQVLAASRNLLRRPLTAALSPFFTLSDNDRALEVEVAFGRMQKLLQMRGAYGEALRRIQNAPWRHHGESASSNGAR
jgi:glycosyltransferase involved in cell wall biosynthesis